MRHVRDTSPAPSANNRPHTTDPAPATRAPKLLRLTMLARSYDLLVHATRHPPARALRVQLASGTVRVRVVVKPAATRRPESPPCAGQFLSREEARIVEELGGDTLHRADLARLCDLPNGGVVRVLVRNLVKRGVLVEDDAGGLRVARSRRG